MLSYAEGVIESIEEGVLKKAKEDGSEDKDIISDVVLPEKVAVLNQ